RQRGIHAPRVPQDRGGSAQPLPPALSRVAIRELRDKEPDMKSLLLSIVSAVLLLAAVGANLTLPPAPAHAATRYVCPPCGSPCDTDPFDKPGACAVGGVALVDGSPLAPEPPGKKVAILVFNGVEIIDYTGPWEVFGAAGYDVYTVAETKTPVTPAM